MITKLNCESLKVRISGHSNYVTLMEGGGMGHCHQLPQGGGRGLAKVSRDKFLYFGLLFEGKSLVFFKIKMSRLTVEGEGVCTSVTK